MENKDNKDQTTKSDSEIIDKKEIQEFSNITTIIVDSNKTTIKDDSNKTTIKVDSNKIWDLAKKKFNFDIVRNLNYEKTVKEIKLNGKNFYALKIKIIDKNSKDKIESTKNEQIISKKLKSESIIKTLATFEVEFDNNINLYLFFLEKSTYKDLKKFITVFYKGYNLRNSNDIQYKIKWIFNFSEVIISFYINQIVKSIYFLKINHLYHNNLTSDNVLICKNYILKLCGFSNLSNDEKSIEKINYFIEEILYEMIDKDYFENKYNKSLFKKNYSKESIKIDKNLKNFIDEISSNKQFDCEKIFKSEFIQNNKKFIKKIKNNNYNEEYKFFIELQKINYLKGQKKNKPKIRI